MMEAGGKFDTPPQMAGPTPGPSPAADARRFASTVEADLIRGTWIDPQLGQTTFAEFAERWGKANLPRLKPTTRSGYESLLRAHLLLSFGAMPLVAIRRHDVEQFVIARITDGLSASRIGQAYRLLGMILTSAVDNDFISKSPPHEQPGPVGR